MARHKIKAVEQRRIVYVNGRVPGQDFPRLQKDSSPKSGARGRAGKDRHATDGTPDAVDIFDRYDIINEADLREAIRKLGFARQSGVPAAVGTKRAQSARSGREAKFRKVSK